MELRALLRNPRFALIFIILNILVVAYLIINILSFQNGDHFNAINSLVSAGVAVLASGLFFRAWLVVSDPVSKRVWLGMAIGFGLWSLGDILLAVFSLALYQELPTPSLADVFWIGAYPALFYAVIIRWRTLKLAPNSQQKRFISVTSLLGLGLTGFFIVRPILADFDPQRLLEGVVNLTYPLADVMLLILTIHILTVLREGRYSFSWRLISAGLFLMTFSDLIYSYATWSNLYYPDGQVNLLTFLVDTSYTLAYATAAFGIWLYVFVWRKKTPFELEVEIAPAARYYAMIGTDHNNEIILSSDNLFCLLDSDAEITYIHRYLWEALGLTKNDLQPLLEHIQSERIVRNVPLTVITANQQARPAWLTAMAIYEMNDTYSGMNIALSADISVPEEHRLPGSPEVAGMLNYLVCMAGSLPEDECQVMRAYFLESIHLFATLLDQFGGTSYKNALFDQLAQVIKQEGLPVEIKAGVLTLSETVEGQDLANLLLKLLAPAQRFVMDLTGEQMVREEFEEMDRNLPANSIRDLDKYQLRSLHTVSA